MIKLMTGNNFDKHFIDCIIELNKMYETKDVKINEVFGSIRSLNTIKTARPDFRVPDISLNDFEYINKKLNDNEIIPNYTINTPIIDHKELNEKEVAKFIEHLKALGIRRVTVAHPLAMKVISKVSDMPIEVSTIYRLMHPKRLYDLKEMAPNINKLCGDVFTNRNRFLLEEIKKHCDILNIEFELIANEFCIQECVVRDQCYHAHVMNKKVEDTKLFSGWPMGYCISHRERNPIEWLAACFILPQHMKYYKELLGINMFKVTGRTAPTKYLSWIVEEYMKQNYTDNLLNLWQDVKNIPKIARGSDDYLPPSYTIDTSKLDDGFIDFYSDLHTFEEEKQHLQKYLNLSLKNE